MGQLMVVTSGKGGSGKSTLSLGLASAFLKKGNKVLLIDCDEGLRCLDLMLGVSDRLVFDLSDIISERKDFEEVVMQVDDKLFLIPAPSDVQSYDRHLFGKFLMRCSKLFDKIIVDCPAGIDKELYRGLPKYSEVLVVETLDPVGCRCASIIENVLHEAGIENKYLIVNKFDFHNLRQFGILSLDDIIDRTGLMLKGIVPFDSELSGISNALNFDKSLYFKAFVRISDRKEGKEVKLPKLNNL